MNKRRFKFKDPMKTYEKPESVDIKINGGNDFLLFEKVITNVLDTMGFKKIDGEIKDEYVLFSYAPKGKKGNK